jgi:succinyl-diaminopimelate desuccinylase
MNYFTDAALLKPALGDPPTVICGPGDPACAHQTDEYVEVALVEAAVGLYVDLARDWCAPRA